MDEAPLNTSTLPFWKLTGVMKLWGQIQENKACKTHKKYTFHHLNPLFCTVTGNSEPVRGTYVHFRNGIKDLAESANANLRKNLLKQGT